VKVSERQARVKDSIADRVTTTGERAKERKSKGVMHIPEEGMRGQNVSALNAGDATQDKASSFGVEE
jgi:hypothetical protein